jgi:ATP-dependent Clp protease ATP-binding subunit ClpA
MPSTPFKCCKPRSMPRLLAFSLFSVWDSHLGPSRSWERITEGKYEALEKYGIDLTKMAKQRKLEPFIDCDEEIRHCIQIMFWRTKNNLVFIGEPGVGRTTIVEGSVFHLQCLL